MTDLPAIVRELAKYGGDVDWIAAKAKELHAARGQADEDTTMAAETPVPVNDPPPPVNDELTPEQEFAVLFNRALNRNQVIFPTR